MAQRPQGGPDILPPPTAWLHCILRPLTASSVFPLMHMTKLRLRVMYNLPKVTLLGSTARRATHIWPTPKPFMPTHCHVHMPSICSVEEPGAEFSLCPLTCPHCTVLDHQDRKAPPPQQPPGAALEAGASGWAQGWPRVRGRPFLAALKVVDEACRPICLLRRAQHSSHVNISNIHYALK